LLYGFGAKQSFNQNRQKNQATGSGGQAPWYGGPISKKLQCACLKKRQVLKYKLQTIAACYLLSVICHLIFLPSTLHFLIPPQKLLINKGPLAFKLSIGYNYVL
jgi:hypothetical protein